MKPNNQKSKRNNEQGAVMFVSVFAVTIFILLAAMIMDFENGKAVPKYFRY